MKRRRKRTAPQGSFEWPVPDVTAIGDYLPGRISERDRATLNNTLPPKIDREKLWRELEPVIRETRSAKNIISVLKAEVEALESAQRKLAPYVEAAALQRVQARIAGLQDALRYYGNIAERRKIQARFKRFRILRAWQAAGGRLTVETPDNPDGVTRAQRRGRGTPSGPLVQYFRTALRVICRKDLKPETVKSLLYRDYNEHSHFQMISASLAGSGKI